MSDPASDAIRWLAECDDGRFARATADANARHDSLLTEAKANTAALVRIAVALERIAEHHPPSGAAGKGRD